EARPQARRGQHGVEKGGLVETEEPDPVAMADAAGPQTGRQSVDSVEELGVGAGGPLEGESPAVRAERGPPGEPATEADVDAGGHGNSSLDGAAPTITPRWPAPPGGKRHSPPSVHSSPAWRATETWGRVRPARKAGPTTRSATVTRPSPCRPF